MSLKKTIIAGIIFFAPYTVSNLFVFIFLIPLLAIIFSGPKIPIRRLVGLFSAFSAAVLLPVITYDAGTYLFSIFIVTLFLGLFIVISSFLIKKYQESPVSIFIPAVVWVMLIYLMDVRSLMSSAFDVGVLFPASAPLIWYVGSIGITVLLVLFNSAVARFLVKRDRFSLSIAILLAAAFLSSYIFSMNYLTISRETGSRKVALVQGDVLKRDLFGYSEDLDDRIARYVELSRQAEKGDVDIVIWPEFSLPVDVMNRFPEKMVPVIDQIKSSGTEYVIGSMYTDPLNDRIRYNSALVFGRNGEISDIYYSEEPAIFNEGITPRDNGGRIFLDGAAITLCWEEISERIFREYAAGGAEYFLALSSNAALDYSWFKGYISYFSKARAAENMRYLARVTQSGITQIVDPMGRVQSELPSGKPLFLTGEIGRIRDRTYYSRHGDILVKMFMLLFIAAMAVTAIRLVTIKGRSGSKV